MFERVIGHQQNNDAYLVATAEHHDIAVTTFDRRMAAHATKPGVVILIPGTD